jgi:hypothetical protein
VSAPFGRTWSCAPVTFTLNGTSEITCKRHVPKNQVQARLMTHSQIVGVVAAFLVAGAGIFVVVTSTSSERAQACERTCAEKGKAYLASPAGTVGRSIEGGRTSGESDHACTCIQGAK